ncbi:hypothetical protein BBAD15_g8341 [Beauveria bassiana D1-5]|uniref:Uncharacterized protein n=1 Tax=Beauveria bassiana D1-5 TaxID=1245745 RepID=A0A0A2W036_BEABA|nr:hypothetical protein BBAD15_g8341 [Beauveria bassiana D1-5]
MSESTLEPKEATDYSYLLPRLPRQLKATQLHARPRRRPLFRKARGNRQEDSLFLAEKDERRAQPRPDGGDLQGYQVGKGRHFGASGASQAWALPRGQEEKIVGFDVDISSPLHPLQRTRRQPARHMLVRTPHTHSPRSQHTGPPLINLSISALPRRFRNLQQPIYAASAWRESAPWGAMDHHCPNSGNCAVGEPRLEPRSGRHSELRRRRDLLSAKRDPLCFIGGAHM